MLALRQSYHASCAKPRRLQSASTQKRWQSTTGEPQKASSASKQSLVSSYQECLSEVKRLDYAHYFCSRYLAAPVRVTSIALRNFNIETAAIKSHLTTGSTAQIRLAWWRQAIDKCYAGDGSGHPVTELLTHAIKEGKLTKGFFVRLLDARERDLVSSQPRTLDVLEQYAEDTASSLIYLTLEAQGIRNLNADHAASHIGKAAGLVTILRALPYHCKSRQVYIPTELTAKHNITSEMLFAGTFTPEIGEAIYDIASIAHGHIEMARELSSTLPPDTYRVLLPAEFYDDYLERLRYTQFNPWDPYLNHSSALTRVRVIKNYYTSKF